MLTRFTRVYNSELLQPGRQSISHAQRQNSWKEVTTINTLTAKADSTSYNLCDICDICPQITMASSSTFPSRPYNSGLARPGSTAPQNAYSAPQANPYQNQPYNAPSNFVGATQQQREAARLERERVDRAERERREEEERGVLDALTEEQREEINEAVRL